MRSMFRSLFAVLGVALALGAVAATAAQAASTNNPQWKIKGTLLAGGKSAEISGKGNGVWRITTSAITTECTKLKTKSGALITGSTAPAAGTGSETLVFEECQVASFPNCKINGALPGTITTEPLTATLAYRTKEAAEKETGSTVVVLKPTTGKTFAKVRQEGTCWWTGEGSYEGGVALETPEGGTELKEHSFTAPSVWIGSYYVNSGGKTLQMSSKLALAGAASTMQGTMNFELASKELWSIFG